MASPTLKLSSGYDIPVLGLGTYLSFSGDVKQAVKDAIDAGYRHFDCAYFYENEADVGAAVREKIAEGAVTREQLFITSKLWNTFHSKKLVVPTCKKTLQNLGLDYIDLYLIHWPMGFQEGGAFFPKDSNGKVLFSDVDYLETWQGLEDCVRLGLTRSIGISNFNSEQTDRVLANSTIKPAVNQIEVSPNINQKKLIEFSKQRGIVITGYSPLGGPAQNLGKPDYPQPSILDPKIIEIAKRHNRTPAQIVLRYIVNLGITVVPKSVSRDRIIKNIQIFDFDLTPEETAYIDSLDKNARVVPVTESKDHKYFPFGIEY